MPHLHRFFGKPDRDAPGRATLRDEEAHHAIHVVRLKAGDDVEVFDGQGQIWTGEIDNLSRREVEIRLTGTIRAPKLETHVTLLQAWLNRDKAIEEIIRRCTEIGVDRFVFFPAARSERTPKANSKWNRLAVESCKQCGRAWLPEFQIAASMTNALDATEGTVLFATLDLDPLPLASACNRSSTSLLVGPEGDFTAEELELLTQRQARPIRLGEAVLRSEVAAILGSGLVLYELGQLGPRQ